MGNSRGGGAVSAFPLCEGPASGPGARAAGGTRGGALTLLSMSVRNTPTAETWFGV